ncbi:STAS domain-containing protein [Cohnella sp. 56]|uniref:STAS domain-containing protein n=1 Tax=Cohnella sp. 56 TaxID=3113722 RepID=UPI0030E871B8
MECDIKRRDDTLHFVLSGKIGAAEAIELRRLMFPELRPGLSRVVLQLEHVTDLDSSGLGLLLAVRNLTVGIGAAFELRGGDLRLRPKLEAIGLLK